MLLKKEKKTLEIKRLDLDACKARLKKLNENSSAKLEVYKKWLKLYIDLLDVVVQLLLCGSFTIIKIFFYQKNKIIKNCVSILVYEATIASSKGDLKKIKICTVVL